MIKPSLKPNFFTTCKIIFIVVLLKVLGFLTSPKVIPPFVVSTQNNNKIVFNNLNTQVKTQHHLQSSLPTFNLTKILPNQSFASVMQEFPWTKFQNAFDSKDFSKIQKYSEQILSSILIPFAIKESPIPVNPCNPPSVVDKPKKIKTCTKLKTPRKLGVLLTFAFEVDALEVHLRELNDLVDKVFLVEGLKINNKYLDKKPSIWSLIKNTPRFNKFRKKVVHFFVDKNEYDNTSEHKYVDSVYQRELVLKKFRLQKFLDWNKSTGYFKGGDFIGIGDTDQIPSRETISILKYCAVNDNALRIGIWFPYVSDNTIFKSDFPVPSNPYTLGNPTYWKVSSLQMLYSDLESGRNHRESFTKRASSRQFLLGGMHFSTFPYLPFQLIKQLTAPDDGLQGISNLIQIGMTYLNKSDNNVDSTALKKLKEIITPQWWISSELILSLDSFRKIYGENILNSIVKVPWFYYCNPWRYPGFKGKNDERLKSLDNY